MSKRFGRNQRRHLRARIELAEQAMRMDHALLREQSETIRAQRETIQLTREVLGNYFAGLPPGSVEVHSLEDVCRLPLSKPFQLDRAVADSLANIILNLEAILPSHRLDKLRGIAHITLKTREGYAAYALTQEAKLTMPRRELIENIARHMAVFIATKVLPQPPQRGAKR